MTELEFYRDQYLRGLMGRREFMGRAAAAGVGLAAAQSLLSSSVLAETPSRGGLLKLGLSGGSTTDSLDPTTVADHMMINVTYQLRNLLVEIAADGTAVPELAESWEAKSGAKEWIFRIRKDVTFHNGKTLDAEDVIYSLNLHRGENSQSGGKGVVKPIVDIRAEDKHTVLITLDSGNADLPYLLTDYHLQIVPKGTTAFDEGIGTGAFLLKDFEPGVRALTERNPNYWKSGRGHVDAVETLGIADVAARVSALQTGQVHLADRLDPKILNLLKRNKDLQILNAPGGQHYTMPMHVDRAPFDKRDVRLALKYAMDREGLLNTVLRGFGSLGNDHPIGRNNPFYADLPQRPYDPDRARHHLKKAGLDSLDLDLHAADAAFPGAVSAAVFYRESAAKAGININVVREPNDNYWSNVWLNKPFCTANWAGRATADLMFTLAYKSDAVWNDSHWRREDFDKKLLAARAELDGAKRKAIYADMQEMVKDDGGVLVPAFADYLDAGSKKVKGFERAGDLEMSGHRAAERVWLES